MANIEKRGDTYRLVVSAGYNSAGRKLRRYRTVTLPDGLTERQRDKELNRLAVLFEQEVADGTYLNGSSLTFAAFTQTWLESYAEPNLAPGTLNPYKTRLKNRILPAIGHLKLSKIQPHHLMEFYDNLRENDIKLNTHLVPTKAFQKRLEAYTTPELVKLSGVTFKPCQRVKSGSPTNWTTAQKLCAALGVDAKKMFTSVDDAKLSEKTIRHHHRLVSSILAVAVKWNLILSNPAERVDLGKLPKYRPAYYDDIQVTDMLDALEGEPLRYSALVYLTIDTGMRSGEICGLKWCDIDFDAGTVEVCRQRQYVSGHGIIEREPKTENGLRRITMSGTVAAMLRQYKSRQIEELFKLGEQWNAERFVFLNEDGTPIHPHRPYIWFVDFLKRHNLPKITFHQLRHTNASLLISAGVDIVTLSGRLGHGDKNVTLNTYSHIIKSKEALAANRMDEFYSKRKKIAL